MALKDAVKLGLQVGRKRAEERTAKTTAKKAAGKAFQGYLVLEGDSWFSYPIYDEVTEVLRDEFGYKTRSAAHPGDTAQEIAYLPKQLTDFEALFQDLADDKHVARAILLSGGGNDVMDALSALLNAKGSSSKTWHPAVVQAVIHEQVPFAISALIGCALTFSQKYFLQKRPILVHGYGDPVPDGRGFKFGITLAGPWMKPVFARKGYVSEDDQPLSELQENTDAMCELMTVFNVTVLPEVVRAVNQQEGAEIAHFVDVRSVLSSELDEDAYHDDWGNELHPTGSGFQKVAAKIQEAIVAAAPTVPADLP